MRYFLSYLDFSDRFFLSLSRFYLSSKTFFSPTLATIRPGSWRTGTGKSAPHIELIVLDVIGRVVHAANVPLKNGIAEVNVSSLTPGIYSLSTKDILNFGIQSKFTVIR